MGGGVGRSRMLAIFVSPEQSKSSSLLVQYRFIVGICLVSLTCLITSPVFSSPTATRLFLLEATYKCFLEKNISEVEAVQSGLLDPYPDGRIHLDWPLTRGVAIRALALFLSQNGNFTSLPGEFSDLIASSSLMSAVMMIGGAFQHKEGKKFCPDSLLTEDELNLVIDNLKRNYRPSSCMQFQPTSNQSVTGSAPEKLEKYFPSEFVFPKEYQYNDQTAEGEVSTSDVGRLTRLKKFLPRNQLSPTSGFDLTVAFEGIKETEGLLDSLEMTIYELTTVTVDDHAQENKIREALSEIRKVMTTIAEKLKYSQMQLSAALLVDPESIHMAADVKLRVANCLLRAVKLSKRIEERLGEKH